MNTSARIALHFAQGARVSLAAGSGGRRGDRPSAFDVAAPSSASKPSNGCRRGSAHRRTGWRRYSLCSFLLLTLLAIHPAAAQYDPPTGYYTTAEGLTGSALKSALHDIIDGHTIVAYDGGDSFQALRVLDQDPNNSSRVLTVYSGTSEPKFADGGLTWNREHCWPRGYGISATGNGSSADESDLFNLKACLEGVNQARGDRFYDEAAPVHPTDPAVAPPGAPGCLYDPASRQGGLWTPRPSEKGDLARAMFYMAVRYDGSDAGSLDLELGDQPNASQAVFGNLATLLQWHLDDPVSAEERRRNDLIYDNYQRNRNPFVDRPEFVAKIFGAPALTLTMDRSAHEEGTTATARLSIPSPLSAPLSVRVLKWGDPDHTEVSVPSMVTVSAGQTSADFQVLFPADGVADGNQSAGLAVWADGLTSTAFALQVVDVNAAGSVSTPSISGAGRYLQNFDVLPGAGTNSWSNNTTLAGWRAQRTGSATTIISGNGSSADGGLYSFGQTGSADRALGSVGSANLVAGSFAWGVVLQNTSSNTVALTSLAYAGEQWRNGGASAQDVTLSYQAGAATNLSPGSDAGWTAFSGADFVSPVTGGVAGPLDGNNSANRVILSRDLDVAIAPGESITLRWRDVDHSGSEHGLAVDDLRIDWRMVPSGTPPQPAWPASFSGRVGDPLSLQLATDGAADGFEASGLPPGAVFHPATGQITGQPQAAGTFVVTAYALNGAGAARSTFTLQIAKVAPSIVTPPTATGLAAGQPLSTGLLTGGLASVPGSFAFASPAAVPPPGVSPQNVVFTPTDSANYDTVAFSIAVTADYGSGFEGASKLEGYPVGIVTLDGIEWTFDDALIGTDANDLKNGTKSARLRNGYITMNSDLAGGIGEVRFVYGRSNFAGDRSGNAVVFVVEYSTDQGGSWQQAGSQISLAGVDSLTALSVSVNAISAARVRIRKVSGDSGKRWNIDNLAITSYSAPAGMTFGQWSGGLASTPELVVAYAVGGAANAQVVGEVPSHRYDGAMLSIEALVRTNDPALRVSGQASTDLVAVEWSTTNVTATDIAKKPGDPADTARRVFSTPQGTDAAKFLHLRIELGP